MNGRMRCAFEAFVIDQHHQEITAAGHRFTKPMRQRLIDELEQGRPDYECMRAGSKWPTFQAAWNLSREALVITLPARAAPIDYQGRAIFSMSGEGRNAALDECRANIESEGVTVSG